MTGDPERAAALLAEGRRRYEAGDSADAEPLAKGALDLLDGERVAAAGAEAGRGGADLRSAVIQLLAECAFAAGRYADATSLGDEVLRLREDAPEVDRAETHNLLGIVALAMGDAEHGHALVAESLAIRERYLGPDAPDTLESLNNTGVALGRLGRMDEAITIHEEALRRCERAYDGPSRQLLVTCNALAVKLDRDPATRPRALELHERGLAAGEAALGPEHPLVVTTLANLGTAFVNAGDRARGRVLIERALILHERRYGADHPNTATVLATASALARADGDLDIARDRAERSVRIRFESFGIGDRRTREAVGTLALAHEALIKAGRGDMADGVALLAIYRDLAPAGSTPDPIRFAADPAAAERALRGYLERASARQTPPDPAILRARSSARAAGLAADTALLRGDVDTAAVAAARAVTLLDEPLGPASLELVEPLHRLAAVERARPDPTAAIAAERRALAIMADAYGERHPFVLRARAHLAVEVTRAFGSAAARPDLKAIEAALAGAEPGGHAAWLRGRVGRMLGRGEGDGGRTAEPADFDPRGEPRRN